MSAEELVFIEGGFQPADILLGRHKVATHHPGNLRLTELTNSYLEEYKLSTEDRTRKSQILSEIFCAIEEEEGRFVKCDSKQKKWYEVPKSVARERISQQFRDCLKDYYKSSLAHKKKRRLVKNGALAADDPTLQILQSPPSESGPNKRSKTSEANPTDQKNAAPMKEEEGTTDKEATTGTPQTTTNPSEDKKTEVDHADEPFLPKDGIALMEKGFEPRSNDVVVGLRKRSADHPGNMKLGEVVESFLEEYKKCGNNKNQKSVVLNKAATVLMKDQDPPARFVRLEPKHKRWYEIEGHKQLISQRFRDMAQDGYRSASTYKNLKRRKSTGKTPKEETSTLTLTMNNAGEEGDKLPEESDDRDNTRLPAKKVAARKVAAANTIADNEAHDSSDGNSKPTDQVSQEMPTLTTKEQLEQQIEVLKKQLETLGSDKGQDETKAVEVEEDSAVGDETGKKTQIRGGASMKDPGRFPETDVVYL